jgi:hypothetical protein
MLMTANNLASSLYKQGKHAEAEEILLRTLEALRHVLGNAHPDTIATAESLENVRVSMRGKRGGKAMARGKERAAALPPSPTALAEAEAKAIAAEAELLAMLELEEVRLAGSAKGKAKGNKGKRG